jgi:TRAP transporter TAXI family solute receptor
MLDSLPRLTRVVLVLGVVAIAAAAGLYGYRYFSRPTTLTIAVGSLDGEGQKLIAALAAKIASTKSPVRLNVIDKGTSVGATQAFAKGEVDLAVVRPDLGDMSNARTVVLVTYGVLFTIALPGTKAESVEDLKGKTIGVVGATINKHLVEALDKEYDLTKSKTHFKDLMPADIAAAIKAKQVQAVMIVAPISERYISLLRALFPRDAKQMPTLLSVDAAAIAAVDHAYESFDIPKGTIRGSPAIPDDDLTTLRVPSYLVAKSTVSNDLIIDLTKAIMEGRSSMISEYPLLSQIAAPSTEKDAAIQIHPGAAAYFNGDIPSIFDKYGDQFFYASMLLGMLSSGAAAIWKFMVVDSNGNGGRPPERLHSMTARIRQAQNEADLETIEDEIDEIIRKELAKTGEGEVDVGALTIALSRLEYLIGQRRRSLAQLQRTVA